MQTAQTIMLVVMASIALSLAAIQPDPRWIFVWIATSALYGGLAVALY